MWPFKRKPSSSICERQGHSWNELAGCDDGSGGTIMVPFDGTNCLHCPAKYKAPPRPAPKVGDKISALQYLTQNYEHVSSLAETYPTYLRFGTYRLWLDHNRTLDAEIQGLWDSM